MNSFIQFIKKIFPEILKQLLIKSIVYIFGFNDKAPVFQLDDKYISNLKVVKNRIKLLKYLPKNSVVAEIGVDKGDFSEKILQITSPIKLHLIDCWNSKRYHKGLSNLVENKFNEEITKGKVQINRGLSTEVLLKFDDNYFDWVYIDTDHSYEVTKAELEICKNKVKQNGLISGHDFNSGNWADLCKYGVIEAVNEFCNKYNWELIFLTLDSYEKQTFVIKRLL
jgi:hypothetical protein